MESTRKIVFLLYLMVEILQLVHEISSFPEVLYKRYVLKNLSKFTEKKHKKQSSGGALTKAFLTNFAKFTEKYIFGILFSNKIAGWKPKTVRSSHWKCFFFIFADQWGSLPKISLFGGAMVNYEKEFTSPFNPV